MRKILLAAFGLILIFAGIGPLVASARQPAQQDIPDLFTEPASTITGRTAQSFNKEVIRSRQAGVNTTVLTELVNARASAGFSGKSAFHLNLFEDAVYTADIAQITDHDNGSYGLIGTVNSETYNELVMIVRDGMIQAYLQDGEKTYEIRYDGSVHTIMEVDSSAYPDAPGLAIPNPGLSLEADQAADLPVAQADTAAYIDVLAVYTPAARNAVGGTAAMEDLINLSIDSTNTGYTASGVTQQVRLVGMEEVSYTENISGVPDIYTFLNNGNPFTFSPEWYAALERLTNGHYTDPDAEFFDDPATANYLYDGRAYRESYNADLVFMVTDLPYVYCGLGWIAGYDWSDAYGFSVLHHACIGSTSFSAQHEMGHNMGACHDRANSTTTCMYDYSYGYQQHNEFYTVMAYSDGCADEYEYCYRINRWSNPHSYFEGFPTGIDINSPDSAYNALTLNNTAINVANYRQSGSSAISGGFSIPTAGIQISYPRTYLDVDVSSNAGNIIQVTYTAYYNGAWHTLYVDNNSADGWRYLWPTIGISEQDVNLIAVVKDSQGNINAFTVSNVPLRKSFTINGTYESRGLISGSAEELEEGNLFSTDATQKKYEREPTQQPLWQFLPY